MLRKRTRHAFKVLLKGVTPSVINGVLIVLAVYALIYADGFDTDTYVLVFVGLLITWVITNYCVEE